MSLICECGDSIDKHIEDNYPVSDQICSECGCLWFYQGKDKQWKPLSTWLVGQ